MIFGYARVSTTGQKLDSQIQQLREVHVEKIISEKISGIVENKNELDNILNQMISGDTLVVTRLDRLGRSTKQLLELVEYFSHREIHLVVLNLGIDTRTSSGKFILTVMAAFSELDRTLLIEKQQIGIDIAKKKGKYKGRRRKYTLQHPSVAHALELHGIGSKTIKEICQITHLSEATFYRCLQERNGISRSKNG
ncbi:recombinase family protein [Carnobacterium maltaromaticum]|uniref:recombinase family protein n=1 Tax=Carnobacterium maltaromaticum TaxID=2751 RepID=UPI0012FA58EF|nr:recombinase family protein [Carnobacterium maltaromaticum]